MYVPEHPGAMQYDVLLSEEVCLVTPPDFPMASGSFDVQALRDVPLILPSTHHGLRLLVESLALQHNFVPRIVLECDGSISLTKRLVMERCGCTVLPVASVIEERAAHRLKCFPLANPVVSRDVALAWPHKRAMHDGMWNVARMIRELATELVTGGQWPGTTLHEAP